MLKPVLEKGGGDRGSGLFRNDLAASGENLFFFSRSSTDDVVEESSIKFVDELRPIYLDFLIVIAKC